jgi:hypothetical protein
LGCGSVSARLNGDEQGSVEQKNGFGLPFKLARNASSWATFNWGNTAGYEPPAPRMKFGGRVKEMTLKPCDAKL